jgi:type 2 lantibiotic biosynthesis protein LanM
MPNYSSFGAPDGASHWWQHAGWYRAATLAERGGGALQHSDLTAQQEPASWSWEQAERRFQQWKAQAPFQNDSTFAHRLAADGLTEQELLDFLAEPPEAVQARLAMPAWLQALRQVFDTSESADGVPLPAPGDRHPTAVFLPALQVFWTQGYHRLLCGIDALSQQHAYLPFELPAVVVSLLPALARLLLAQASRTFALELKVAGRLWHLEGTTPEARFQGFVQRLSQREVLLSLLEEYPVQARQLVLKLEQWVAASLEFLDRLCADWHELRAVFSPEDDPGMLLEVKSDASDHHRGGRSVLLLTFASGLRLVYKPKSLAIDHHFQELLLWLNGHGAEPPFQPLTILDRGPYGWSAFVTERECASEAEVQRFYERQGAYLALLYALEATDLHCENLIAAGEHPMLVDLEALFQPRVLLDQVWGTGEPAFEALQHSVARVGLLPFRIWGSDEAVGVNLSGLGGEDGQLTPHTGPHWEGAGTDQMRLGRARREIPVSQNRPRLHGQHVDALTHQDRILGGFTRMYRLLIEYREALLADILPRFAQDAIRFIARPTEMYARFLNDSFRPELLRDALERERHFDRLWVGIEWQPALARLIPAERADLLNGDVPLFTTRPASRDLITSQCEVIPAFFQKSSLDLVRKRLRQFDGDDLALQVAIIKASFGCLVRDTPRQVKRPPPSRRSAAKVTREHLLAGACQVGEELSRTAIRGAETAGWLGLAQVREREWTLQSAGLDLYNGLPGITLFLAYLAALTGEQRYRSLAEKSLQNILTLLTHPHKQEAMKSIGAFEGWGGLIYLFSHLGHIWNQPSLFQAAEEVTRWLPGLIEDDKDVDIMAGAAGCLTSLLSLYTIFPPQDILELAIHCGDHLLGCAQPMQAGMGWKVPSQETPLTGLAHGAAGIALSLFRLAAVSGADRFHQAALAALAYERRLFSPARHNWPDLRAFDAPNQEIQSSETKAQHFMVAWCHGAAGIGLARLASLPSLDDAAMHQEIRAALQTTLAQGFEEDYTLCHGMAGNLETLLLASQMLDGSSYQEALDQGAGMLFEAIPSLIPNTTGALGTEPPGLMVGTAGIGYTLLRLAAPECIPSVLVLAPPIP